MTEESVFGLKTDRPLCLLTGAAVIAYALLGVFSEHRHPALIHWFARQCPDLYYLFQLLSSVTD